MRVRRVVVVGVVPLLLGAVLSGTALAAGSGSAPPTITGFAATPASVTTLYGGSTISASVTHATSCILSAKPAVVSGSGTFTCSKTTPVSQTLKFPENTSSTAVFYKITLKAIGAGGTADEAKQTIMVSVAPGAGGLSPLSGVEAVVGDGSGFTFCALLTSGEVDCWGDGSDGQLGNGAIDTGSATPVQVEGLGGTGTLSGVASLTGDNETFCALLASGGIDCWGAGIDGELGNGSFTPSATPVQVEGVGGTGALSSVASLTGTDGTLCALLTSGKVDCWGDGFFGQLGNGVFYTKPDLGSATPVHVEGVGGTGTLGGVTSLTGVPICLRRTHFRRGRLLGIWLPRPARQRGHHHQSYAGPGQRRGAPAH